MLKTSLLVALSAFLDSQTFRYVLYSSCFYILMLEVFYTCFHYCLDSFVRSDQSQTSLAGKHCEIQPMKDDFCKDFIRTGRGDWRP